ncbi:elongation factor 1, putative [Eimeria brunetti]|uniref:Elongation factor 1, putative n=1 Tax=Eimeria brunetti TaxID=51314 RepID=U6LXY3_9EIME|nr:elongation factor 1, putative [Eimeria brunetti]
MAQLCPTDDLFIPCSYYYSSIIGNKQNAKQEEEDIDLFGDDDGDAGEELKKLAAAKKEAAAGKKKKEVINKSMLVIEIKPNNAETDLNDISAQVKTIKMEGLAWGENVKKIPVAFGLYKLQVQCVIVDDLVDTQEVLDKIEELGMSEEDKQKREEKLQQGQDDDDDDQWSGLVQSAQIVSFNKL